MPKPEQPWFDPNFFGFFDERHQGVQLLVRMADYHMVVVQLLYVGFDGVQMSFVVFPKGRLKRCVSTFASLIAIHAPLHGGYVFIIDVNHALF
ncbi:hypothetical protein CPB83DRAFT_842938 [Crepidotus variabilis]|uniref:Uncharacterized protein n=1 Tax=Crepidotus variabilis TaxID=179855 RepID=A0A9P6JWA7_9AGAR|nr:hypothetical protein CPB83DRAFT_842938 [Crepidotus variabilis]